MPPKRFIPTKIHFINTNHDKVMKNSNSDFSKAIIDFKKALDSMGISFKLLRSFFSNLETKECEKVEIIDKIHGGVSWWASLSMFVYLGKKSVDQLYERKFIRESASRTSSALRTGSICLSTEALTTMDASYTSEPALRLVPSVVTDKKFKKHRKLMFESFLSSMFSKTDPAELAKQVKYWRAMLDAHRVSLHIDGKHTYTKEIMHADLFLKILEAESLASPKKADSQNTNIKFIGY